MSKDVDDYKIPRFNGRSGDNFSLWSGRVEMALRAKDLFSCVEGERASSSRTGSSEESSLRRDKAAALIIAALGDKPLQCVISDLHNPARIWAKLKARYASPTTHTKVVMYQRMMTKKPLQDAF